MAVGKIAPVSSITPSRAVSSVTSRSKNIQNQILEKEQNLNSLSADKKLSTQEKEKKRQELQKEIEELNRKLELMRMEKEEAEKKAEMKKERKELLKTESNEKANESRDSDKKASNDSSQIPKDENKLEDMSIKDVQKILNTNMSLQENLIENSADFDKTNTVRILKAEIELDELYGADTESKKKQLEELRKKENFWIQAKYAREDEISRQAVQLNITE